MKNLFDLFYQCNGVSTDTRKIEKDSLFICLKGANFNGNTFAEQALLEGAKFVIVDEEKYQTKDTIYLVEDTLVFLQKLANYHRSKFDIPVIGITGSNGKTSTKELMNCVLSESYSVLATKGNLNNHIGVPLTLLKLTDNHEIAIIEMGANRFKDIAELCEIAQPTHGIITNIGKAHLEGFKDFEGVLQTKRELYESIGSKNGTIIYNADDLVLTDNLPHSIVAVSYGTDEKAMIHGNLIGLTPYVKFNWKYGDYDSPVIETKMVGKYNFYNYLAAVSFGVHFSVPFEQINEAIRNYTPDNNRSQIKKTDSNTLIMDCYNANPTSMRSALESFGMINHPTKFFVIGDMLELGTHADTEHKSVINYIEHNGLQGFTVGPLFKKISNPTIVKAFDTKQEALEYFKSNKKCDSLILLKGSRGIGLEALEEVF